MEITWWGPKTTTKTTKATKATKAAKLQGLFAPALTPNFYRRFT